MSEFNSADESSQLPKILGGGLFIAVLATLVYWPSLKGAFIIDDDQYVTHNPNIYLSDGLARLWFTNALAKAEEFYYPISYSSFWLDWRLWGKNPTGYRVTNLTLHILTAWLLWAILQKLSIPGAFLGALLFTVHPVNVECVAWVFQRRDLLAAAFGLLSIACYLQADPRFSARPDELDPAPWQGRRFLPIRTWGWYALSLTAYALGMLSKLSIAPLPVILLLIVWWKDRIRFGDVARIGFFFLAGGAIAGFNLWVRAHQFPPSRVPGIAERLDRAGAVVWFYLSKALLPINLSFTYPQWHIDTSALLWWLPLLAAASVTALLFWRHQRAWGRALVFAWVFFCLAIAPVSGIDDVGGFGHSIVWDHYEHLALIGAIALVAAGWGWWRQRTRMRRGLGTLAAALVCLLSVLAWQRNSLFGSPINLYRDAVSKTPESWLASNNLGLLLLEIGSTQDALPYLEKAMRLNPLTSAAHYNLGYALQAVGRAGEAIEQFQESVRLAPLVPEFRNTLGLAFTDAGRLPEAIDQYQKAIKLKPDYAEARNNLGFALAAVGRLTEAIEQSQRALEIDAGLPNAHLNLGVALSKAGKLEDGIKQFGEELRLNPDCVKAYSNMTKAYALLNRSAEAIASAEKALELARSQGQTSDVAQLAAWLAAYRSQQDDSSTVAPGADPAAKGP